MTNELQDARAALRAVVALIEDGVLVRNTAGDGNFAKFTTDGLRIVKVLKQAQDVLDFGTPEATP